MAEIKALTKTTKSPFDIQVDNATKALKHTKGICFAMRCGNTLEYVNIPNSPDQTFKYFHNSSHMTNEERQAIYKRRKEIKLLTSSVKVVPELIEEEI